jgi:hypothetical protein
MRSNSGRTAGVSDVIREVAVPVVLGVTVLGVHADRRRRNRAMVTAALR